MAQAGIAAQVYSVREQAEKDFAGTMTALKEYGYQGVELAGLYGHSPEKIRDWLKELELQPVSAHVGIELFQKDMEGTVRAYETIGCTYIGIPGMSVDCFYGGEKYEETCRFLRKLSACCAEHGMTLMYHNHCFEFEKTAKGTFLLDELFSALGEAELQTEQDTGWVKAAGVDPVAYLEKYKNRCPVIHLKDYGEEGGEIGQTALGQGIQDVRAVVQKALECGTKWMVVEQDDHPYGDPMENMGESARYLKEILRNESSPAKK